MPKTPSTKKTIAVSLELEQVEELLRFATMEDRPISRIAREIIDLGIPAYRRRHGIPSPDTTAPQA
jgi:hypothetical protein